MTVKKLVCRFRGHNEIVLAMGVRGSWGGEITHCARCNMTLKTEEYANDGKSPDCC